MRRHLFQHRARWLLWLTIPLLACTATESQAGDIIFKNETKVTLVVQGWTYLNRQKTVRKAGPMMKIEPGKSVTDFNVSPPSRAIVIFDSLGRRLYARELPYDGTDCTVAIRLDARTNGLSLTQIEQKKEKD
jgi:hypothetical protein